MSEQRIGHYELRGLLGEGGIGQVYVARDTVLGRQAAIKTLRPEFARDRNFLDRFFAEAQGLANLSHSNITTLYGFHPEGPRPFMAMELVRGHTLAALLTRLHRLPARECLAIAAQAAAGLAYAHGEGVVHRDIKPENLMITERGVLKIMDFGIARVQGTKRLTRAGQIFGTLLYAPPEQIRGAEVDQRSDLYSLAVVLYEMLSGSPPFTSENEHALMTAHLETPPPPLAARAGGLAGELPAAIMRALEKRPEDRFASIAEFARAAGIAAVRGEETEILQQLIVTTFRNTPPPATRFITVAERTRRDNSSESRSTPSLPSMPTPRRTQSLRAPALLLAAAVAGLTIGVGYVLAPKSTPNPPAQVATLTPPKAFAPSKPSQTRTEPGPSSVMIGPQTLPAEPIPTHPVPVVGTPIPASPRPPIEALPAVPVPAPMPQAPSLPTVTDAPTIPRPDLAGTVQQISAASKFTVAGRKIQLWGIDDSTRRGEHIRAVFDYLLPYRGVVECYHKAGDRYQCYAGGHDLAVLALQHGFARPTSEAPREYRELGPASLRN